ncbi:MAG TPA: DUF1902 domain-containing protein [Aurantimonas sp.]|jgi:predicted RNase H-like HicB family nuclease|nr:DUF1902 domain-containing protein [Aurantimonas sp.]
MSTVQKEVAVDIIRHKDTGLFVATSEDMRGLIVHARTWEDLIARVPQAIKAIAEADTNSTVVVTNVDEVPVKAQAFIPNRRAYSFSEAA